MNNRTKDRDYEVDIINSDKVWTNDPSLPSGWMICEEKESILIKCPDAEVFESRKKAIEKMIKERYSPTEIFKLWNTPDKAGWVEDQEILPAGLRRNFFPGKGYPPTNTSQA